MSTTSDAVLGGIASGVAGGIVAGYFTAKATVSKAIAKTKGDGNTVITGNTGQVTIYASPEPPTTTDAAGHSVPDPRVGPYLVPYRNNRKFYVRNMGTADAFSADWTASAVGGEPSVVSSGVAIPSPMRPGVETMIALDVQTFGSGATTIDVTWADGAGRISSNRLNV